MHQLQLHLEFREQILYVTASPMTMHHPLFNAITASAMTMFVEDFWAHFSKTMPWTLPVPLAHWRHVLHHVERNYEVRLQLLAEEGALDASMTPLTYVCNGQEYNSAVTLPRLATVEVAGSGFTLTQPVLRVSDPCYERNHENAFCLDARPGHWRDFALTFDLRQGQAIGALLVLHESVSREGLDFEDFQHSEHEAGVDSGQCGFFDDALYPEDPTPEDDEPTTFYENACDITLGQELAYPLSFGTIDANAGVVAAPVNGDGRYACGVLRDDSGRVVAAILWFLPDEEQDEADPSI